MRDYQLEFQRRVAFIRDLVARSGVKGIVYGNSGGKDCTLVGILCKAACDDTVGILMPCASARNFGSDLEDGKAAARQYGIETRLIDLTPVREAMVKSMEGVTDISPAALSNIAPRLRMNALYAIAGSESRLVAGTGNRSERFMGYFTKWGDGACDFNPIADLTATEVFEFLDHLNAPLSIRTKAPSAGLFEGQTDEQDMGITYAAIDRFLLTGEASETDRKILDRYHNGSEHKRRPITTFED